MVWSQAIAKFDAVIRIPDMAMATRVIEVLLASLGDGRLADALAARGLRDPFVVARSVHTQFVGVTAPPCDQTSHHLPLSMLVS